MWVKPSVNGSWVGAIVWVGDISVTHDYKIYAHAVSGSKEFNGGGTVLSVAMKITRSVGRQ